MDIKKVVKLLQFTRPCSQNEQTLLIMGISLLGVAGFFHMKITSPWDRNDHNPM